MISPYKSTLGVEVRLQNELLVIHETITEVAERVECIQGSGFLFGLCKSDCLSVFCINSI
jgi:hypothetical protein